MQHVCGPGIERGAFDIVPGAALPIAEIDFAETSVDACVGIKCGSQASGPPQGAGDHRCMRGNVKPEGFGNGQRIIAVDVELPIANARQDARARMADQENLHSNPP